METVRIIVTGLGSFGPSWARLVHSTPEVTLAAVVEPMDERRNAVATELGLAPEQAQRDLTTALREVEADAVVVVTPPQTHLDVASIALQAGKPVLVEKPLAASMDDARALVTLAKDLDQLLVVSQNYRYRAPMITLRKAIAQGDIGDIVSIGGNCQEDMRLFYEATNFRYLMHHPYIIDMTIHHWDLLRYLTGRDIHRVYAKSWRVPDSPYQQDPSCAILLELDNGTPVTYQGSGATNLERTSWSAWWDITGEKGRLWTDGGVGDPQTDIVHRRIYGQQDEVLPYVPAAQRDTLGSLLAFTAAVRGGSLPDHTGADNLKSLAAVMACVASVERNALVDVAEFLEA